jgi:hypothetical protein
MKKRKAIRMNFLIMEPLNNSSVERLVNDGTDKLQLAQHFSDAFILNIPGTSKLEVLADMIYQSISDG